MSKISRDINQHIIVNHISCISSERLEFDIFFQTLFIIAHRKMKHFNTNLTEINTRSISWEHCGKTMMKEIRDLKHGKIYHVSCTNRVNSVKMLILSSWFKEISIKISYTNLQINSKIYGEAKNKKTTKQNWTSHLISNHRTRSHMP